MSAGTLRERANRWLLFVLGAWLAMTVAMAVVASANFHVVEPANLRDSSSVFGALAEGGERRQALRYVASEINRYLFDAYGGAQLAIAVLAWALYLAAGRWKAVVTAALSLCTLFALALAFHFTPEITEAGRRIDFMPRDPEPPEVAAFYALHRIVVGGELVKLALLAAAAHVLTRPRAG